MNRRDENTDETLLPRLAATQMHIRVLRNAVINGNITYQLGKSPIDVDVADQGRDNRTKTTIEEGDVFALPLSLRFYIISTQLRGAIDNSPSQM
jgi:hypothetical protein